MEAKDYVNKVMLLDGLTSPEYGFDEIVTELILKHELDFLHDNNEDAVRDFASDLKECILNYIKTEDAVKAVEIDGADFVAIAKEGVACRMMTDEEYKHIIEAAYESSKEKQISLTWRVTKSQTECRYICPVCKFEHIEADPFAQMDWKGCPRCLTPLELNSLNT